MWLNKNIEMERLFWIIWVGPVLSRGSLEAKILSHLGQKEVQYCWLWTWRKRVVSQRSEPPREARADCEVHLPLGL